MNDELALLWMVQMHCIDMNAWYSRVDKPDRPDFVLFDLDPPDDRDDGFGLAIEVAHLIRELLDEVGLPGWVKTSGADGIHVVAPILRRSSFEQTYDFAERASRLLERRHPGKVTTEWLKRKREGVLVDHRQNGARQDDRLGLLGAAEARRAGLDAAALGRADADVRPRQFSMQVALERIAEHGDLFAPVLSEARPLGPALKALGQLEQSD